MNAGYYRSRIRFIHSLIAETNDESDLVLLRNGVLPTKHKKELPKENRDHTPLTFTELCSFNTWFEIHPDKVMGKEKITTSREFPITIQGTKEQIEAVFLKHLHAVVTPLPIGWRAEILATQPLKVQYTSHHERVLIEHYEDKFMLRSYEQEKHSASHLYSTLDRCNYHLIQEHFRKSRHIHLLELEAECLEVEIKLLEL